MSKGRTQGISTREIVARRMLVNRNAAKFSVDSRQQQRAKRRKESFASLTKQYGGEPRKARRGMAITLARKHTPKETAKNEER